MKCVSCGKPAGPLAGGNSLRDALLGKREPYAGNGGENSPATNAEQFDRISAEICDVKKLLGPKKRDITPILAAISILLCFITFVTLLSVNGKINKKITQLKEELVTQIHVTDEKTDLLADVSPEPEIDEPAQQTQTEVRIIKDPGSEDDVASGGKTLFICRATGENLKFSWMRYDAATKGMVLIEDQGAYVIENSEQESKLSIMNTGTGHEGVYICKVEGENGQILYSAPATLRLSTEPSGTNPLENFDDLLSADEDKNASGIENGDNGAAGGSEYGGGFD